MAQPTADALIVHFLSYVHQARGAYIERYLRKAWGRGAGTTRNALSRLVQEGRIQRVGYGMYPA